MSKKFKLSGSTKRLIEKAISRGWHPGGKAAVTFVRSTTKPVRTGDKGGTCEC